MDYKEAIKKFKLYLEAEYKQLEFALSRPMFKNKETVKCTLDRALGVAFFMQYFEGYSYEEINALYEEYKNKYITLGKEILG